MEHRDQHDDDESPAPLPAHERQWRHPSEVGFEAWQRSEPPIALGRALSATTGAIGALLVGAIVLTLLPTHAGRPVVSARSVVSALPPVDTAAAPAPVTSVAEPRPDGTVASSTLPPVGPAAFRTPPTYHVADDPSAAVAVSIGELVITTANAALGRETVELVLDDGSTDRALVLAVDRARGLALLAPHPAGRIPSFRVADSVHTGDELTIVDGTAASAVLLDDGRVMTSAPLDELREGTPIIDRDGALVALLTHASDGPQIVFVDTLDDLRWAVVHATGRAGAQLGLGLDGAAKPALRIATVVTDGPAARAGLEVDDEIVAVNGVKVRRCDSLIAALAERRPGDTVVLTVRRHGHEFTATVVTG